MDAPDRRSRPAATPPGSLLFAQEALAVLWDAQRLSRAGDDPWQFATELSELHRAGVTRTVLRGLLRDGVVRHAVERTGPHSGRRQFEPVDNLFIPDGSCFVLTEAGARLAMACAARPGLDAVGYVSQPD